MTKQLLQEFRILADQLPPIHYTTTETEKIKGEDVLLAGTSEVEGKPVDPEKEYQFQMPVFHPVNHYRRIKKIYQSNVKSIGVEGAIALIQKYVSDCFTAVQNQTT